MAGTRKPGGTGQEDVAIVTVADRGYLPAACCQLVSVANNLDVGGSARLFLVLCDVSDEDVADARRYFGQREIPVDVVVPDFIDRMMTPIETRWPRAAYLRIYFDWLFDERWKRIIYFDADTRVGVPLSALLDADLRGQPIGAVHDFIFYVTGNIHRRRRILGLAPDAPYFQSGVMVMDWQQILASDGLAATRRFLSQHPDACLGAPDQDALNATFEGRWTPLDPRWNMHEIYLMFGSMLQPWVMHFTSTKPWSRRRPRAWREIAAWYRRELASSPWSDFVESQSLVEATVADMRFTSKRLLPHLWEPLARYVPFVLRWAMPRREGRYRGGHLPWVPRRSRDVEDMAAALVLEAQDQRLRLRPPEAVLKGRHW